MNKFWLNGISSIILDGVGDGMIPWCALVKRIPIVCCYDREIHKSTIEAFLLEKIIKKMEAAIPGDTRWYRSSAQLGCRENEHEEEPAKSKAPGAKGKAATAKGKVTPAKRSAEDEAEESQESGEESASESKTKTSKKHKTTPVEKVD